jgi:hypothetical protein
VLAAQTLVDAEDEALADDAESETASTEAVPAVEEAAPAAPEAGSPAN